MAPQIDTRKKASKYKRVSGTPLFDLCFDFLMDIVEKEETHPYE